MKFRLLAASGLSLSLSACFLWSSDAGPKPAPLPQFSAAASVRVLWQQGLPAIDDALLSPAFSGGSVYAASRKGDLARYDAAGQELWRVSSAPRLSGGVASNGTLVAVASSDGELWVHDAASGVLRWKQAVDGEVIAAPLLAGDLVLVRVGDNQLAAFAATDGKRRWVYQRAQAPLALRSHSGLAQAGDLLFAGFPGGKLLALSLASGLQRWEATISQPKGANEIERMADVVGDPLLLGEKVCVASFQGRAACVDRVSGRVLWTRDFSSSTGIAADTSAIYLVDSSDAVYALDVETGASKWKQDKLSLRKLARPLVLDGKLVVADVQGYVHVLDAGNGQFLANLRVDSSGVRAPMLALPNEGFALQAVDGDMFALTLRK